jgi:hypothetical protein
MNPMNLLRSICCLFAGPCAGEEPEPKVRGRSEADLGQKEANVEKASEEELRHMEGTKAAEPKVRGRSEADLGQKEAKSERASEEELRHMEGGKAAEAAVEKKRN